MMAMRDDYTKDEEVYKTKRWGRKQEMRNVVLCLNTGPIRRVMAGYIPVNKIGHLPTIYLVNFFCKRATLCTRGGDLNDS